MLHPNVVAGVHRVEDAFTNWYVIEADGAPDRRRRGRAGARGTRCRSCSGRSTAAPGDIQAVVLTHAHFDHVGFAERARRELGVPVYVHENDAPLARHPWRYDHERPRAAYLATQVEAMPIVAALARHRAFFRRR